MSECATCGGAEEIPVGGWLGTVGGFEHPNQRFVECPDCSPSHVPEVYQK